MKNMLHIYLHLVQMPLLSKMVISIHVWHFNNVGMFPHLTYVKQMIFGNLLILHSFTTFRNDRCS